jgi:aromatic ring-opening dioxygenase LigB subunit
MGCCLEIPLLNNNCANVKKIMENYSKIHTILCSAGHSHTNDNHNSTTYAIFMSL